MAQFLFEIVIAIVIIVFEGVIDRIVNLQLVITVPAAFDMIEKV